MRKLNTPAGLKFVAILLLAPLLFLIQRPVSVGAEPIENAITNISSSTLQTTVFEEIELDVEWAVPDGSMGGDFFTLVMPPQLLVPNTLRVEFANPEGEVLAVATALDQVVTFTLTDSVNDLTDVSGFANFAFSIDRNEVTEGTVEEVTVSVPGGPEFPMPVEIVSAGNTPQVEWKFLAALEEPSDLGNPLVSGVFTRTLNADDIGAVVIIEDTPGPGIAIDCRTTEVTVRAFPSMTVVATLTSAELLENCTPTRASVQLTVTPNMVGHQLRFWFQIAVTDPLRSDFSNSGTVTIRDEVTSVSDEERFYAAGGAVNGTPIPPTTTTTTVPPTTTTTTVPPTTTTTTTTTTIPPTTTTTTTVPPTPTTTTVPPPPTTTTIPPTTTTTTTVPPTTTTTTTIPPTTTTVPPTTTSTPEPPPSFGTPPPTLAFTGLSALELIIIGLATALAGSTALNVAYSRRVSKP